MTQQRVLIVDDEPGVRFGIKDFLQTKGYAVEEAENCVTGIDVFRKTRPDLAIVDYRLPDGTALDVLARFRALDENVPVVVLTAHGSIDLAVRTIKEGAEQFLTKPVELPALLTILERNVEHLRNRKRQLATKSQRQRQVLDPFVGESSPLRNLEAIARKVVTSESPVLIVGETGSGKGILAHWLHENGNRSDEPFVDLNCAGLSSDFLESELFGHVRGAFTSAVKDKVGLLEMADRGTLFLDEIGDMDLRVQAKLLKVLEEQRFRRLGGTRDLRVDVRLIAATHRNLSQSVQEGAFRQDLYFRINTVQLIVPPLRRRGEDIVTLAGSILRKLATDLSRGQIRLEADAEGALQEYSWPGNIRELRNVLERALLLSDADTLSKADLRFEAVWVSESRGPTDVTLREMEIRHIERTLHDVKGRVPLAAERLGIPKSSLYQKLKTYQLELSKFRNENTGAG
jgi:DNA-binding NtrC family response regulator